MCHILDSTYKWYHMVFVFLFLTYFTYMIISTSILVAAHGIISFFLWLSYIPLCVHTHAYVYKHIHIYHIFSTHSSVDGHLGCSHVLATMNSVAMNIKVQISFWIIALDICPGVGLLDHKILFLVFWGNSLLFFIVVAPTHIPTNCVGRFPFPHILSSICYLWTFSWWPFWPVWGGTSL